MDGKNDIVFAANDEGTENFKMPHHIFTYLSYPNGPPKIPFRSHWQVQI